MSTGGTSLRGELYAPATESGTLAVVLDNQDLDLVPAHAVDDRVGKHAHRESAPLVGPWRSDFRMLQQQLSKALELRNESSGEPWRTLFFVEGRGIGDIPLRS